MTIGGFRKETAQIILDVVQYLRESGFVIKRPGRGEQFVPPDAPIYVRNDTGEEIPPFACLQTDGTVDVDGQNYVKVVKPVDDTGASGGYLFNGIAPVEVDGYGIAHDGPVVRMLTDGSIVTNGDKWQPDVGEFAVIPGGSLFTAIGLDDIETDVMRAFVNSTGSTITRIEFVVVSATTVSDTASPYNGMRKLVVTVKAPSCNAAGIWNTTVDVYEHQPACLTEGETDGALVDRKGWAYQGVHQDMSSGASAGDLTPCHYVLDGLCCP